MNISKKIIGAYSPWLYAPKYQRYKSMLATYADLLLYVNDHGFLPMSGGFLENFPSLGALTEWNQWHTGDSQTDPWQWKDCAASERTLAFGCVLGGYKGFISSQMYPYFYAALHPRDSLEEQYADGKLNRLTLDMYGLFTHGGIVSTADIRRRLNEGREQKHGTSKLDRICEQLQAHFYISVCGNTRKVSSKGEEYGWSINAYCLTEDYFGDWCGAADNISPSQARERIMDCAAKIAPQADMAKFAKILFGK